MKFKIMIRNLKVALFTLFLMMLSIAGYSQPCAGSQATVTLQNIVENSQHTQVEFDVFVSNTGSTSLLIQALQGAVIHNTGFLPAGATGTFTTVVSPAGTGNFPNYNIAPTYTAASRQMRWTSTPVNLASGNTIALPPNTPLRWARFRFTSSLPFTQNFAGSLTPQFAVQGGFTNVLVNVYCNGNPNPSGLGSATAGTLVLPSPYLITLNPLTDVCFTSGAASNLGAVTCFGGSNGSATITMNPVPSNLNASYTVNGGPSTPVTLSAGGSFSIPSGLVVGSNTINVFNSTAGSCPTTAVVVPVTISGPTSQPSNTTTQTACDSFTWSVTGLSYTTSGTYNGTSTDGNGCTVNEVLNLTINNSTSSSMSATACDSYTWAANGTTYTTSGTYTNVTTNAAGCPDTATLVLTINNSTSSTMSATACDSYVWAANGTTYTASGTYTNVTTNAAGCPDTATLVLTINNSTSSTMSATACDSYVWAANGTTYTASGTYTNVTTNAAGCPDTATLVLTINSVSASAVAGTITCFGGTTTVTVSATGAGTPFTGTGIFTVSAGPYSFTVTDANGCTSTVTGSVSQPAQLTTTTNITQSTPYTWAVSGLTYSTTGVYTFNTVNGNGCTVINTLNLTIATGPVTVISPTQCGTTLTAINQQIFANLVSGAQGYRFRVTDLTTNQVQSIDRVLRVFSLNQLASFNFARTYSIEVAVLIGGVWQSFGAPCNVTTPGAITQVQASQCSSTLTTIGDVILANNILFAGGYQFRITNLLTLASVEVPRFIRDVRLNNIPGFTPEFNTTYSVEVAVRNRDGNYLPYGPACDITTPSFPTSQLQLSQCDVTISNLNTVMFADSFSGATTYRFRFVSGSFQYTFDKPTRSFVLGSVPGLVAGTTYSVQVSLEINGVFGPYGKICTVTLPSVRTDVNAIAFQVTASPNPFTETFMLDVKTSSEEYIQVRVYDMLGKLLEDTKVDVSSITNLEVGTRFPAGVYNVIVSQGDSVKTLRVIKR